jgi:hypothetical protein
MAGVDGLGHGCAVACDRLGGIAAADVTIESFVAQGIFGGLVHDSICRVLNSFLVFSGQVGIYSRPKIRRNRRVRRAFNLR